VTIFPTSFFLGSEMADFGFSVAGVALADGDAELSAALREMEESHRNVRKAFNAIRSQFADFSDSLGKFAEADLLGLLNGAGLVESALVNGAEKAGRLNGPRFQARLIAFSEGHALDDINAFIRDIKLDYVPNIRRLRMLMIKEIYLRAERLGATDARLDPDFEERFMSASTDEADSWQETAHLICGTENLSRLITLQNLAFDDRTEEYSRLLEANRPSS
jgi:hypothetical protein